MLSGLKNPVFAVVKMKSRELTELNQPGNNHLDVHIGRMMSKGRGALVEVVARRSASLGYRIYFGKDGDVLVILLGGGTKKPQNRDIQAAQACWVDYKRRKKQETC